MNRNQQILEYIKKGKKLADIARMFGVSRQRIWQLKYPVKRKKAIRKSSKIYYYKNKEYRKQWNKQNRIKKLIWQEDPLTLH